MSYLSTGIIIIIEAQSIAEMLDKTKPLFDGYGFEPELETSYWLEETDHDYTAFEIDKESDVTNFMQHLRQNDAGGTISYYSKKLGISVLTSFKGYACSQINTILFYIQESLYEMKHSEIAVFLSEIQNIFNVKYILSGNDHGDWDEELLIEQALEGKPVKKYLVFPDNSIIS